MSKKIMIIDDEKDVLFLLRVLLEKEGFEVIEAQNGKIAYEKLTDKQSPVKPDLIILDVMMPEMDGYTFETKMLESEELKKIPVIILTAKGQIRELFEISANVEAFVEKPFDPKKLVGLIKGALQNG
ncbi:MAG: response regulator [Elusimicrobiales bacterium]|nr:response regulator [Elusimicrobiales bacterium]